ncbi:hypothetical protein pb186bvf_007332 [Paramecium bursaria]
MKQFYEFIRQREEHNKEQLATVLTIFSALFHSCTYALFKGSHQSVSKVFIDRGVLTMIILWFQNGDVDYFPKNYKYIIIFALFGGLGTALFFGSMMFITVGEAVPIFQMNSLFSQIFAICIIGDKLRIKVFMTTIICLFGVLLISRPQFNSEAVAHMIGCVIGLMGSMVASIGFVTVNLAGKQPAGLLTFYFHFFQLAINAIAIFYVGYSPISIKYIFRVCLMSFSGYMGFQCSFKALQYVSYNKIANYNYLQLVYSMILDYLLFSIIPHYLSVLGSLVIVGSILYQINSS